MSQSMAISSRPSEVSRKILVIQDAGKEPRVDDVKWALENLVKTGDIIRLFRVVQPFKVDSTGKLPSFGGCSGIACLSSPSKPACSTSLFVEKSSWSSLSNFLAAGNGSRLHSESATISKRQEEIEREIQEKQMESMKNPGIQKILELADRKQIDFETTADTGSSLKHFTIQAAKDFEATYVILDSHMRLDEKYILENLTCGVLRVRRNGKVKVVRELTDRNEYSVCKHKQSAIALRDGCDEEEEETLFENSICSVCGNKRPANRYFREFTYSELAFATYSFSRKNLLSKRDNRVYRGTSRDGLMIVMRKHFCATIKEDDFKSTVLMLRKARHEHVATLLGFCSEGYHRFLVYEFVCSQSLNTHLSQAATSGNLTWERRMKIALGTAKGLEYLHRNNIYGCVRPSNILLTHDYQPRLANFGLTRNQYEDLNHTSETSVFRTFEYLAPEYGDVSLDSSETDIYSFGVVLLELITGRRTLQETKGRSFLRWARPLLKEKIYGELIDPTLNDLLDLHQLVWMVRVAEKCLSYEPKERYSIQKVVADLTNISEGRSVTDFSPADQT